MKKILLVVGGSSDIGIAAISALLQQYELVVAHYNHMNEKLRELQEKAGNRLLCLQADLSDEVATDKLVDTIKEMKVIPSDILHLPAAAYQVRKFHKTEWNIFERELNISVRSAVKVCTAFLPEMAKERYGRIVLMLSIVVNGMPPKYNADYVLVKYALLGLVKALAVEYADRGIRVNGISPALMETKFIENIHDYIIEQNAQQSPTGRNLCVEEVIPTIQFLLSEGAEGINGQNISITYGR